MDENDELLPEYEFDYTKSKPNRFAEKYNQTQRTIVLDSDIAREFPSYESVNESLRFLVRITREHKTEITGK